MKHLIRATVASLAVSLVLLPSTARAEITPTRVLGGPLDQIMPTANAVYLTWASNVSGRPRRYNVYSSLLAAPDSPTRVNPAGTQAYSLSINGDTTEAIYQELPKGKRYHSNVYLYDLLTQARTTPPAGVNTRDWEWAPMISPGFILFGRNKFDRPASPWKVILYDRTNFTFTTLGKESYACFCIFPGVVTDDFATWTDCAGAVCQAYYYDIANSTPHKIPNPLHAQQYDASVNGSGTELYYVRSGNGCGIRVKIMRWTIGGGSDPVVVSALPAGYDVAQQTFTYTDLTSHDQVYFDRARCSKTYPSDLYVVQDADTALTAAATVGATAAPGIRGQKASQFVGPDSGAR